MKRFQVAAFLIACRAQVTMQIRRRGRVCAHLGVIRLSWLHAHLTRYLWLDLCSLLSKHAGSCLLMLTHANSCSLMLTHVDSWRLVLSHGCSKCRRHCQEPVPINRTASCPSTVLSDCRCSPGKRGAPTNSPHSIGSSPTGHLLSTRLFTERTLALKELSKCFLTW